MFELTKDQEIEIYRLQEIVDEKRRAFQSLQKQAEEGSDLRSDFKERLVKAESELNEAAFNFNDFTGKLPLKNMKSSLPYL